MSAQPLPVHAAPTQLNGEKKVAATGHIHPASLLAPTHDIKPDRKHEDIAQIAESYRGVGILQPVLVFKREDGRLEVIDGWTRVLAALLAGLKLISIHDIGRIPTPSEILAMQVISNLAHAKMTDFQLGAAIVRYMQLEKCSQSVAGKECGLNSEAQISRVVGVHKNLCDEGKAEVLAGRLPFTSAAAIGRLPQEMQKDLITKCVSGLLKRDFVAPAVNKLLGKGKSRSKGVKGKTAKGFSFVLPPEYSIAQVEVAGLLEALKKGERLGVPMSAVPALMKGR